MEAVLTLKRNWDYKRVAWILLILLVFTLAWQGVVFADAMGGLVSEKLMGRSGVADSDLWIGRSGVDGSQADIGLGAIISTQPATSISRTATTLNGNLSDLNGFPSAIVYFEWGYDTSYGFTTASQVVSSTGDFSTTLSGYNLGFIYFRAVSEVDGTMYGEGQRFQVSGKYTGYDILWMILPIIIFFGMSMAAIRYGSPAILIGGILAGLLSWVIIQAFLNLTL